MAVHRRILYLGDARPESVEGSVVSPEYVLVRERTLDGLLSRLENSHFDMLLIDRSMLADLHPNYFGDAETPPIRIVPDGALEEVLRNVTDSMDTVQRLQLQNQYLESLHGATETLLQATEFEDAAQIAIDSFASVLDRELLGIWLTDEEHRLSPIAATAGSQSLISDPPRFGPEDPSIAWNAFEQKETQIASDLDYEPDRFNPDTVIGSEIVVPLGEFGVMIVASTESDAFVEEDVRIANIWGATVTMVFIRIQREHLLKEREQTVRRERDRLDEFASLMSHDLRNPLTVANGYLELASSDVESPHLDRVQNALERMETLISDMLILAREGWQHADPEPVVLSDAVRNAWAIIDTKDATLSMETEITIEADQTQIGRLLENLIGNAILHGGDAVTVTIGALQDGFYIADSGTGIDPEEREDIFNTGYSTSEEGTGFGLAIVAAVAEAHDWEVTTTESQAGGARFEIHGVTIIE